MVENGDRIRLSVPSIGPICWWRGGARHGSRRLCRSVAGTVSSPNRCHTRMKAAIWRCCAQAGSDLAVGCDQQRDNRSTQRCRVMPRPALMANA